MKLGWYINRLRNMEPAEVLYRLVEHRRRAVSRGRDEGWARYPAWPIRPVFPGLGERIRAASGAQRRSIAMAAEAILAGRFSALGRDWPAREPAMLFPPELWRLDPVTGALWPGAETYTFDIDFRHDGSRGDIKYAWEINRLQMLPVLAAHALLEDDARSLAAIDQAIKSWHAANPPFRGIGWASGIEVALRAISLIVTLDLLGDRIGGATGRRIGEILAASAYWLPRFPSRFSSANNHLVAELAGEFLIGLALGVPSAAAREALQAEALKQILPDGSGAEQSPTYGAFTAELVLLCATAARAAGTPFVADVAERLSAFADFVSWLGGAVAHDAKTPPQPLPTSGRGLSLPAPEGSDFGETAPQVLSPLGGEMAGRPEGEFASRDNFDGPTASTATFGDDDEGRVLTLGGAVDYAASVAAAIKGFLGQPGISPAPGDFHALLFGAPTAADPEPAGLKTFTDGGLSVWRGDINGRRIRLNFDHGPLGYLSIAAHGHADALALTLSVDGIPVLVDPGTWLYGSGGVWRNWFRSTPAHNTLNIDGVSQSTMAGAFNWSHKAETALVESLPGPDWQLTARHDGYRKRFGLLHQRTLAREAEGIAVTDRLIGGGRVAEIVFQLAHGLAADRAGNRVMVRRDAEVLLEIHFPDAAIDIAAGGDSPSQGGWVSPGFGVRVSAGRVSWRGKVDQSGVRTWLFPAQNEGKSGAISGI